MLRQKTPVLVLLCLSLVCFPLAVAMLRAGDDDAARRAGSVIDYDGHVLTIEETIKGNTGDLRVASWRVDGFWMYVGIGGIDHAIIPKSLTVRIRDRRTETIRGVRTSRNGTSSSYVEDTYMASATAVHAFKPPPDDGFPDVGAGTKWVLDQREMIEKNNMQFRFMLSIRDHRHVGVDDVHLHGYALASTKGEVHSTRWMKGPNDEGPLDIHRDTRSYVADVETHLEDLVRTNTTHYPDTWGQFEDTATAVLPNEFSYEDFAFSDSRQDDLPGFPPVPDPPNATYQRKRVSKFNVKITWAAAAKKGVDATLTPDASDEPTWCPHPEEDARSYTLTLNEPTHEEVDAIRFTLVDVSQHPGIATNAGNHALCGSDCPDCTEGRKSESRPWETFFHEDAEGEPLSVMRTYRQYNDCAIDEQPDLYFRDGDNEGWELGEGSVSEGLTKKIGWQITLEKPEEDSYSIKLRVKDAAAGGKLQAMVQWQGVWYPARATGATANDDETALLLPLDRNSDGIQDTWAQSHFVTSASEDKDINVGGDHYKGDGLTAFEEYRGVYVKSELERLHPTFKDMFVYDYSNYYDAALEGARQRYRPQGLFLWALDEYDFREDLINWTQPETRNGDQYILVMMRPTQVPGIDYDSWGGKASHIGPPTRDANTVFVRTECEGMLFTEHYLADRINELKIGTVAHEIGHNINVPHHGDAERSAEIDGEEHWIACLQGQHSGNVDCIMKYNNATKFLNRTEIPWFLPESELVDYTSSRGGRLRFCTSQYGTGQCGNAADDRGVCLNKICVKSY